MREVFFFQENIRKINEIVNAEFLGALKSLISKQRVPNRFKAFEAAWHTKSGGNYGRKN